MNGLAKGYGPKKIPANHAQLNPGTSITSGLGTTLGITTIPEEVVEDQNPDPMPTQKTGFFASLFGSS